MSGAELWDKLMNSVEDGLAKCIDTGEPFRCTMGAGERSVTIDIYQNKASMKKFDEIMLGVVKEKTGIDIAKGGGDE